jgi:hypothetical protein
MADDFYTQGMSLLCPLDDEHLPLDASNLKSKQVGVGCLAVGGRSVGESALHSG